MGSANKTVLIIDDDPTWRVLLRAVARKAADNVLVADRGEQGLALAREHQPDLILCDVEMPGMNGFELRRRLIAEPALAAIPFIFMSGNRAVDSQLAGLRLGGMHYLVKPIAIDTVLARIVHCLSRPRPSSPARTSRSEIAELAGRLELVPCADLMQLLEANHLSGTLVVSGTTDEGTIVFRDGVVVDAESHGERGEDAAFSLLWQSEGSFTFDAGEVSDDEAMYHFSVGQLLHDAMWIHDELRRLGERAPVEDDLVAVNDARAAADCVPSGGEWESFLSKPGLEPPSVSELAALVGLGVHRFRAMLARAVEQGSVQLL